MASLLAAFRLLKGRENRVAVLNALHDDLDKYESRAMAHRLAPLDLKFDIVGSTSLPLEILMMIFSYLDPVDPFRLQRVSRQWRQALNKGILLDASLALWYSSNDSPLMGQSPELGRSEDEVRHLKLEHIGRFRSGTPSAISKYVHTEPWAWYATEESQIYRDFVAFRETSNNYRGLRTISLIHLPTGRVKRFGFSSRQMISGWTLGENYLVFGSTAGKLCAIDLTSGETHVCRLPQLPSILGIAISHKVVWVLAHTSYGTCEEYEFVKWDLETGRCREINTRGPTLTSPEERTVFEEEKKCNAILLMSNNTNRMSIILSGYHIVPRYRTTLPTEDHQAEFHPGQLMDEGSIEARGYGAHTVKNASPVNYEDSFQMPLETDPNGWLLGFDARHGQALLLSTKTGITKDVDERFGTERHLLYYEDGAQFWKDTLYRYHSSLGAVLVESPQVKSNEGLCADLETPTRAVTGTSRFFGFHMDVGIVGNETFMVLVGTKEMLVLCFDPDIKMAETSHFTFGGRPRLL